MKVDQLRVKAGPGAIWANCDNGGVHNVALWLMVLLFLELKGLIWIWEGPAGRFDGLGMPTYRKGCPIVYRSIVAVLGRSNVN
jgi:hypothetical protein